MKANPLGGASMAKGIVLEKVYVELLFCLLLSPLHHPHRARPHRTLLQGARVVCLVCIGLCL
jgi:hypothetical protein